MPTPTVLHGSHNYYIPGGAERYFFELSDLLEQHGHKVIPFCGASDKNRPSEYSDYFPPAIDTTNPSFTDVFRFIYSRDARRYIKRAIHDLNPDIAHLHIYHGKLTSSILGALKENHIPIVQTLHEYKLLCPVYSCVRNGQICEDCQGKHFWKALAHRCNRGSIARSAVSMTESYVAKMLGAVEKVDHFIGVSQFMTDKMLSIGVPRDKISTVHNFVDSEKLRPAAEPGKYVLYFGRLDATKGLFTLLDAMRDNPDLQCVIAGSGPDGDALQAYASQHNMQNVRFPGFVEGTELQDMIRGAVCTVLPAEWYENCPMSVLESLAYARPVIGTRIGGIPELIDDGQDGLIVEPGDREQLSVALRELGGNPHQSALMGRAGREKVARRFSPAHHYAQIRAIYDQLLSP